MTHSVALKLRLIGQSGKTDSRDFWHFDCCEFIDPLSLSLFLLLTLYLPPGWPWLPCHTTVHTIHRTRRSAKHVSNFVAVRRVFLIAPTNVPPSHAPPPSPTPPSPIPPSAPHGFSLLFRVQFVVLEDTS